MGVPAMNKTIPYNWDDFTMLGLIERNPFVLVVSPASGIKSFADFEKKIKAGKKCHTAQQELERCCILAWP